MDPHPDQAPPRPLQVPGPARPGEAGPLPGGPPADGNGAGPAQAGPPAETARGQFAAILRRAGAAASWRESARHYARLVGADGHVRVAARFGPEDLSFLGTARDEVLALAGLGQQLAELHQPLEPAAPAAGPGRPQAAAEPGEEERCRHCLWRWPCPTFRVIAEALAGLDPAGPR